MVLDEVEGGIISRYEVLANVGPEHQHLRASLEAHRQRFGRVPDLLAGDRGVYSPVNERLAAEAGVRRVVLPKGGRVSLERREHERQRWFQRGFRFRAGIEGRISVLRRGYRLCRCLEHGEEGMSRWVGWGILAHNLAKIAHTVAERSAKTRAI